MPIQIPAGPLSIVPTTSKKQWHDFHHLPFAIYRDDSQWVPPLLIERKLHFTAKHNPYFQHAKAAFFLAYRGETPVGRITAQIDELHVARYGAEGHFGFIEAFDDAEVFAVLLNTAEAWLRDNDMKTAIGPVSFSLWDQPGLLVEGFDTPPYVMMAHALPYYAGHISARGYQPAEDLIAYRYGPDAPTEMLHKLLQRSLRRGEVTLRNIHMDKAHFKQEVAMLLDIINDAWSDNWGFVHMTRAEIDDLAGILKLLLRPGDVAIAEYQGEPAAFAAIFPNLNEAIADMNGRLLPFNWAKLLWRMKVSRPKTARMPMMGVRKKHQATPMGAALSLSVSQSVRDFNFAHGVVDSELSWILSRNTRVDHVIRMVGGQSYKRYRIYQKPL